MEQGSGACGSNGYPQGREIKYIVLDDERQLEWDDQVEEKKRGEERKDIRGEDRKDKTGEKRR